MFDLNLACSSGIQVEQFGIRVVRFDKNLAKLNWKFFWTSLVFNFFLPKLTELF